MSWCPQCGAEYRAGFHECADCGVALVDEQPPPVPGRGATARHSTAGSDHSIVEYELDDWTGEQRLVIELELDSAQIAYAWYDGRLQVGGARQDEVDALIDSIDGEEISDEALIDDDFGDDTEDTDGVDNPVN
jgi:hypothetical protein